MRKQLVGLLGVAALGLAACGDDGPVTSAVGDAEEPEVSVVASFYPLAEAAARVGGDRVSVQNLTPAGADPHDLELDPRQVEAINAAAVTVVMGRGFQPAVEQVAGGRDGETVEILRALPIPQEGEVEEHTHDEDDDHADEDSGHDDGDEADHGHSHDDGDDHADDHRDDRSGRTGEGPLDPHVWLDLSLMAGIVDEVADALAAVDPGGADGYADNAEAYREELAELDERFEESLADCRLDLIVVQHEAFGWMADRYGLRQEAIAGISHEQEPDPRRMAELVRVVEDEGVEYVFTEALVSPRVAEALAREAGVETLTLNPLEGLTAEQADDGDDFVTVMEQNRQSLVRALDCEG